MNSDFGFILEENPFLTLTKKNASPPRPLRRPRPNDFLLSIHAQEQAIACWEARKLNSAPEDETKHFHLSYVQLTIKRLRNSSNTQKADNL
jgi:hypothetical protein